MAARNDHSTVFVGNVDYQVSESQLYQLMETVGAVKGIRVVTDRDTGKPKGYAFVEFHDRATAESAQRNLNGYDLNGRKLRIDLAQDTMRTAGGGASAAARDWRDEPPYEGRGRGGARGGGREMGAPLEPGFANGPGGPAGPRPLEAVDNTMASMSKPQLYQLMRELKELVMQNPNQARQVLSNQPQMTRALFQAQLQLGMLKPKDEVIGGPMGVPQGVPPPPALGPGPQPMVLEVPPAAPQFVPPADPRQATQAAYVRPADPRQAAMQQPANLPAQFAPQPGGFQGQPQAAQPAGGTAALPPQQQQELIQKVMAMTPEQIELLPPQQRQQVLAIRAQLGQR